MRRVKFIFEGIDPIKIKKKEISVYVNKLIENEEYILGDITVVFCNDNYLLEINRKYLNHDHFTDIITFNYNVGKKISGDLLISLDRIRENAELYNKSFENELYRVIFHGILHLIGYDDKDEEMKKVMREKENDYLRMTEKEDARINTRI